MNNATLKLLEPMAITYMVVLHIKVLGCKTEVYQSDVKLILIVQIYHYVRMLQVIINVSTRVKAFQTI